MGKEHERIIENYCPCCKMVTPMKRLEDVVETSGFRYTTHIWECAICKSKILRRIIAKTG